MNPARSRRPGRRERAIGLGLTACLLAAAALLALKAGRYDRTLFAGLGPSAAARMVGWDPAPLQALLPARAGDWPRQGEVEVFPYERIPDKIDGAIGDFEPFGVKGLVWASYADPARAERTVDLYLYEMKDPPAARGILDFYRTPVAQARDLGQAGWQEETTVAFQAGPLFVQVLGMEPGEAVAGAALALARAVAAKAREANDGR